MNFILIDRTNKNYLEYRAVKWEFLLPRHCRDVITRHCSPTATAVLLYAINYQRLLVTVSVRVFRRRFTS